MTDVQHARPNKSRRRKKRRTEDFLSSSSSSSSSEASGDEMQVEEPVQLAEVAPTTEVITHDELKASVQARLKQVPFTEYKQDILPEETHERLIDEHAKERDELDKKFLHLMTSQFGNDLDELRKKPDFNDGSLVVLAQALQSGSNMFNGDEIDELLKSANK